MALRWDMTGLTAMGILAAVVVATCGQVWLRVGTKVYWRVYRLCCRRKYVEKKLKERRLK
jgi:hypothetical protein